jgi:hypothetical protein
MVTETWYTLPAASRYLNSGWKTGRLVSNVTIAALIAAGRCWKKPRNAG